MKKRHTALGLQKRLLALVLAVSFLFACLTLRIAWLTLFKGGELAKKAADQWTRDLPLRAQRGDILDANGLVLATDYTSYSLFARPRSVSDREGLASLLAAELDSDRAELLEKLSKNVSEVTVGRRLDKARLIKILDSGYLGLYYSEDKTRYYPGGDMLCPVLGFTDSDNAGQAGLEAYYDRFLRGTDGQALTQTDIKGIELAGADRMYIPAIPGLDVRLTIDREIQLFAEGAVKDALDKYKAASAGMLVMDCTTGAVAAMAAAPSYDLNDPPREQLSVLNLLTKNFMLTDVMEPGSTFKIFTIAAAVQEGLTNENERFHDPGFRIVDGQRIKCWRTRGHGSQTLLEAVNNSCNPIFMDLALRLGTDKFYGYLKNFGFGEKTGIDFMGESRGIMMRAASVKNVDLARIGFGQAVAVTPLQMVAGACAVVNGGILYKPYLVSGIYQGGRAVSEVAPVKVRQVISGETSARMRAILENVVATGSGRLAQVPGYRIGGKTGTAQKYTGTGGGIAQGKYVSSFIGFMPADNPKYVALMMVNEPSGYVYYGSLVAAPYAGQLFKNIAAYQKLPSALVIGTPATLMMPNLIGLPVEEAEAALEAAKFYFEVAGEEEGIVISQLPAPGETVAKNTVALIRCG